MGYVMLKSRMSREVHVRFCERVRAANLGSPCSTRPSSWWFELNVYVHRIRVCPGSVGTRQALLQRWLLCVVFVCLANVPALGRCRHLITESFLMSE